MRGAHRDRDAKLFAKVQGDAPINYQALGREFGMSGSRAKAIIDRERRRELNRGLPPSDFRHPEHPLQDQPAGRKALWANLGIRHDEALLAWAGDRIEPEVGRDLIMRPNVGPMAVDQVIKHLRKLRQAREENDGGRDS